MLELATARQKGMHGKLSQAADKAKLAWQAECQAGWMPGIGEQTGLDTI